MSKRYRVVSKSGRSRVVEGTIVFICNNTSGPEVKSIEDAVYINSDATLLVEEIKKGDDQDGGETESSTNQ